MSILGIVCLIILFQTKTEPKVVKEIVNKVMIDAFADMNGNVES